MWMLKIDCEKIQNEQMQVSPFKAAPFDLLLKIVLMQHFPTPLLCFVPYTDSHYQFFQFRFQLFKTFRNDCNICFGSCYLLCCCVSFIQFLSIIYFQQRTYQARWIRYQCGSLKMHNDVRLDLTFSRAIMLR